VDDPGNTFKAAPDRGFLFRWLVRNFTEALTQHTQQYYGQNRGASNPNSIKKNPLKPWKPIEARHRDGYDIILKQVVEAES